MTQQCVDASLMVKDVSADFPFVKWLGNYQPRTTG